MRITGGQWRGRTLAEIGVGDADAHLRPSSDRFRESLFNILQSGGYIDDWQTIRTLDLFAGTGALSFEALSRGAIEATLIDNGRTAAKLIQDNRKRMNCGQNCQLLRLDVTQLGECPSEPFDLIFLDPPYAQNLGEKAIQSAKAGGWMKPDAIIVWEEEVEPKLPFDITLLDQRKIGRALLTIARFEG